MSDRLLLADADSAIDALTFALRASTLGEDAVRLQASGGVLAMTAAPLAPKGLGDPTPTVLGMRTLHADPELVCDVVVVASAVVASAEEPRALVLPPTGLAPAWAGISAPRGGWTERPDLDAATLAVKAQSGIAQVAEAVPTDAGEDVVRAVRARVWGQHDQDLAGLPLGVAFAAFVLGFVNGAEPVRVRVSGPWTRLSLHRGHVLVRGPLATGMTAVRRTGTQR